MKNLYTLAIYTEIEYNLYLYTEPATITTYTDNIECCLLFMQVMQVTFVFCGEGGARSFKKPGFNL